MTMTADELAVRLSEADRQRAVLRRCTLEWRALGDRILQDRQRAILSSPRDGIVVGLFKILSTRDRDLEDARAALRRSGRAIDVASLEHEVTVVAAELTDVDVRARWTAVRTAASTG
jgi:hypothetical protein